MNDYWTSHNSQIDDIHSLVFGHRNQYAYCGAKEGTDVERCESAVSSASAAIRTRRLMVQTIQLCFDFHRLKFLSKWIQPNQCIIQGNTRKLRAGRWTFECVFIIQVFSYNVEELYWPYLAWIFVDVYLLIDNVQWCSEYSIISMGYVMEIHRIVRECRLHVTYTRILVSSWSLNYWKCSDAITHTSIGIFSKL